VISGTNRRDLPGAENGILIRYLGDLNLSYETFVGPTYDSSLSFSYVNSSKYGSQKAPIWRVGETVLIDDYFEKRIPGLDLKLISNTPSVCATDGLKLVLIAQGNCNYVVFAPKTNNYIAREYKGISLVESARTKPTLFVQQIPNQVATGLPKNIEVPAVYATSSGYLVPLSQTPNVCVANLFTIRILSGGTCTLTYQAPETSLYKATDVYVQTFEITRTAQTLDFVPLNSVALSAKTLTLLATASSGLPASFSAEPTSNCMVSGNTLSLLKPGPCTVTAQQVGTATIAPVSKSVTITITGKAAPIKRTISCVKGSKTVKVTKVNPKCPKGYSRVR
jgi:hypothetical protein